MKYVSRILTAAVAAAIFPVFFFAPLLRLAYSVILAGESELTLSLKELISNGGQALPVGKLLSLDAVQPLKPAILAVCILLALALVIALAVAVFSLLSDRYAVTAGLSGAGTALMLCALIPMHTVSTMLVDGSVSIGALLAQLQESGAINAGALSLLQNAPSIADVAVQIKSVGFGTAYYLALFFMIFLLIWGVANVAIGIGEKQRPVQKPIHKKKKK